MTGSYKEVIVSDFGDITHYNYNFFHYFKYFRCSF